MVHTPTLGAAAPAGARADFRSLVAAGLLWGTGGLAGAVLSGKFGLDPLVVAACRLVVGGTAMLVAAALTTGWSWRWSDARRTMAMAGLAAWYQSCYFVAVELTSVSLATMVTLGASPVILVLVEVVTTRRRPARRVLGAVGMAIAGLVLLVGGPGGERSGALALGVAFAVASAAGFAAVTVHGARVAHGTNRLSTIGTAFVVGGLLMVSVAALTGQTTIGGGAVALGVVLYLGVVPTATAYALYFRGLRSVAPSVAALVALLEPLTAAVLGAVVLDERLGVVGIAGAVLVAVAVVVSRRT